MNTDPETPEQLAERLASEEAFKARELLWSNANGLLDNAEYELKRAVEHLRNELYSKIVEPEDEPDDLDEALRSAILELESFHQSLKEAHALAYPDENDLRNRVPADFRAAHPIDLVLGYFKIVVGVNRSFAGSEWDVAAYRVRDIDRVTQVTRFEIRAAKRATGLILEQVIREVTYQQSGQLYDERINDLVTIVLDEARKAAA